MVLVAFFLVGMVVDGAGVWDLRRRFWRLREGVRERYFLRCCWRWGGMVLFMVRGEGACDDDDDDDGVC